MESTLHDSAADAQNGAQTGKSVSDLLASQYGSNTQPDSQQLPSQNKLEHTPGMINTQASQATPAEPNRSPLEDAGNWPVSWHAEQPEPHHSYQQPQSQSRGSTPAGECLQGRICAGSMGSGDVLLYSFSCSAPEVEVHAWPPTGGQAGASSDAGQPAVGAITVTSALPALQHPSQPGQCERQQAQGSMPDSVPPGEMEGGPHDTGDAGLQKSSAGFTWRPAGMTATFAQGLPRRICQPLKAVER